MTGAVRRKRRELPGKGFLARLSRSSSSGFPTTAVAEALAGPQQTCITCGARSTNRYAVNRRLQQDASVVMAPDPAGAVDPEIGVCAFMRCSDSAPLALLANVTMHPTTLGVSVHAVSADYPGRVIRQLQSNMADDGVAFLIQGAAGDSKPLLDARATTFREGTGRDIGRWINAIVQDATPLTAAALRVDHRSLQTRFARAIREAAFSDLIHRMDQTADAQPMPASDGTAEWNRGHLDHDLLDQERRAWTPYTFVVGYCNGTIGYVPTAPEAVRGGYETTEAYRLYGLPAALHPDTAAQLEDAAIEMLEAARPS